MKKRTDVLPVVITKRGTMMPDEDGEIDTCFMCGKPINRLLPYHSLVIDEGKMERGVTVVTDSMEIATYHIRCSPFKSQKMKGNA